MKIYRRSDLVRQKRNEQIDLGFDSKDSRLLDRENDFSAPVQIIAKVRPQHITKLDEKQYCSSCRSELILLEKTQKDMCNSCGNAISVIANAPLLDTNQELRPFGSQVDDPLNEDRPFSVGLIDSEPQEPDWEVTQSSYDGRVQSIKLKKGISPTAYRIKPD